jgi:hypothetical protein
MNEEHIDELKTVSFLLKSNDVLLLELGAPTQAESITLQCVPVFGNDTTSIKRNARQPGYKAAYLTLELTFSITKEAATTIEDVRIAFLNGINALITADTTTTTTTTATEAIGANKEDISPLDALNTRLRSTNWAEEAADLPLSEVATSTRTPLLLASVVSSGLLKSKSLLHLEMGRAPLPGVVELEIFIDTRDMGKR